MCQGGHALVAKMYWGKNACPPEDIGAWGGFERFLKILSDPTHEEHEHTLLCYDRFDPTACELPTEIDVNDLKKHDDYRREIEYFFMDDDSKYTDEE